MGTSAQFEHHQLSNGLQVLLWHDKSLPLVTSLLSYRVGSVNEVPGFTGASHFLEHMLFKGSKKFGKGEIDRLTQSCGGDNNAFTWLDATSYHFSLPASHWQLALEIEADRMQYALLDAQEIEAERQVILEEWQSSDDDPDEKLWESVNTLALQRHPYRYPVLGWPEDIHKLSREQLNTHYSLYYRPNQATLVLVGDLPNDALACIEQHLGQIPAGPSITPHRIQERRLQSERRVILRRSDVQVPRLAIAWPAPPLSHADYFPFLLLHYLLTEGWSSRLHQLLVEKHPLATEVSSLIFETQDPYLFWLLIDLHPDINPEEVEQVLFQSLESLSHTLSNKELERARIQLLTDYYLNLETTDDRAEFASEILLAADFKLLEQYPERLKAVSKEQVLSVVARYLSADNRTLGWLLPNPDPDLSESELCDDLESEESDLEETEYETAEVATPQVSFPPDDLICSDNVVKATPMHLPTLQAQTNLLTNGLRVFQHNNSRIPSVCVSYFIPAGSRWEQPEQAGLASLTLSALVKGTQTRSALAFSEVLESYGASLSLSCGLLGSSLQLEVLTEYLDPVLELLQETLYTPALSAAEIKKEQAVMLAGLKQAAENHVWLASNAFTAEIYRHSPAARPIDGLPETLSTLSPEQVLTFYQDHYRPQGALLTLSGALDKHPSEKHLEKLASWQPGTAPKAPEFHFLPQNHFVYRHINVPEREQCAVFLGHLGVSRMDPDFLPLLILDNILGNGPGFSARIPRVLRDQAGLAYHVSYTTTQGCHLWPGLVQAQLDCAPEKVLTCVKGLLNEIRNVQEYGINKEELYAAKAYLSGRFIFHFETNTQRIAYFMQQALYNWPENYLNLWLQRIQATSLEEIQEVARKHLNTHNYTLITAGPALAWGKDEFCEL